MKYLQKKISKGQCDYEAYHMENDPFTVNKPKVYYIHSKQMNDNAREKQHAPSKPLVSFTRHGQKPLLCL